jgi:hypothetical protein
LFLRIVRFDKPHFAIKSGEQPNSHENRDRFFRARGRLRPLCMQRAQRGNEHGSLQLTTSNLFEKSHFSNRPQNRKVRF